MVDVEIDRHLRSLDPYLLERTGRQRLTIPNSLQTTAVPPLPVKQKWGRLGIRRFVRSQIHLLIFTVIHFLFSIYIRLRQAYHAIVNHSGSVFAHHHGTPELIRHDVGALPKLPRHLSVVLKLRDYSKRAGLETLVSEVADIAAWCASAGIPMLSVYERSGLLKEHLAGTHRAVARKLSRYFADTEPALSLGAPDIPFVHSPAGHANGERSQTASPDVVVDGVNGGGPRRGCTIQHLKVLMLSEEDGRGSIVDLTQTLTEMAQRRKISPRDISVNVVDAELREGVINDPDLLIVFAPYPDLDGYPPWQLRLTEIFSLRDNSDVSYHVFLKGLYKYANAEMRLGR